MRDVLFKTEKLTEVIGAESHLVRTIFNHVGPYIGSSRLVQENSTARMSQVALAYCESPLSENHAHGGSLHAGDRVPDLPVRHRTVAGWADARLQELLDSSLFVLLVTRGTESDTVERALRDGASAQSAEFAVRELSPPAASAERTLYEAALGRSSVYLVRPDGYVGFAAGTHAAATGLASYRRQWFAAEEAVHAH